jgi:hypothetical protein
MILFQLSIRELSPWYLMAYHDTSWQNCSSGRSAPTTVTEEAESVGVSLREWRVLIITITFATDYSKLLGFHLRGAMIV